MPTTTTTTPTTTPTPAPTGARLITDRVLAAKGATRGRLDPDLRLETVRDHLRAVAERQAPTDHMRTPATVLLDYANPGGIAARFVNPNGPSEPYLLTRTAYSQLTGEVLPARGGGFLLDLAGIDDAGARLASVNYAKFATQRGDVRTFRTRTSQVDGRTAKVLRSVHSANYAAYDNLRYIEDLLMHAEVRDLPVLQYNLTDSAIRIRFGLNPLDRIELRTPTPMVEAWNSETGQRKTGLQGGIWKLICTNGAHTWEAGSAYGWRHYGDADRIASGVGSAVSEIRAYASGAVDQYVRAVETAIDDAAAWLASLMESAGFGASTVAAATAALDDETTTRGRNLASAVDAVTLIAQHDGDLIAAAELERFGGEVLRRGLNAASRGAIRVSA